MSEDRPRYEVTKPAGEPLPTNAEIAERLRDLAHDMRDIGMTMDYVGGFGDVGPAEHHRCLDAVKRCVDTVAGLREVERLV